MAIYSLRPQNPALAFITWLRYNTSQGSYVLLSSTGKWLLVGHTYPDNGALVPDVLDHPALPLCSGICCCSPAQAKEHNPELPILGDWDGTTLIVPCEDGLMRWGPEEELAPYLDEQGFVPACRQAEWVSPT